MILHYRRHVKRNNRHNLTKRTVIRTKDCRITWTPQTTEEEEDMHEAAVEEAEASAEDEEGIVAEVTTPPKAKNEN